MSTDFVTTFFPYGFGILGNGLARSYYPDDLFHHMFVSCYHMLVSRTMRYFGFIISLSYEARFLSYLFVSPYII